MYTKTRSHSDSSLFRRTVPPPGRDSTCTPGSTMERGFCRLCQQSLVEGLFVSEGEFRCAACVDEHGQPQLRFVHVHQTFITHMPILCICIPILSTGIPVFT